MPETTPRPTLADDRALLAATSAALDLALPEPALREAVAADDYDAADLSRFALDRHLRFVGLTSVAASRVVAACMRVVHAEVSAVELAPGTRAVTVVLPDAWVVVPDSAGVDHVWDYTHPSRPEIVTPLLLPAYRQHTDLHEALIAGVPRLAVCWVCGCNGFAACGDCDVPEEEGPVPAHDLPQFGALGCGCVERPDGRVVVRADDCTTHRAT